ncbi:DUF4190 domain-containing protein [Subtercola boreus]|uniref:DUF4190 domain-containing protein n=1 Tax=Subtercola boreus TaxID=120213 RepID=A0A3E0W9K7_9MICO|nr:DUF4190 domain-containing protein [Subtercola boreus]RFA19401.1 hypothetical protein B7R24_12230 [Subtercola boreus]RFA19662.1 hypothetical protein B7R23_12210 [Subtercola boreus]RFA26027.1 hypothetical protein B7R25_12330 [Subtercola boreus]
MTTPNPYAAPGAPARKTNVLSIVALVVSIVGFTIIGIVLGFVSLNQIKKTGEAGRGLALAAIIIGFVELVLLIIYIIFIVVLVGASSVSTNY